MPGVGSTPNINTPGVNPVGVGGSVAKNPLSQASQPNIGETTDPPSMKTLVYSPDVRVIIAHGTRQYDVSSDIVRCSLHRAEDSAASFFMTLANKNLRYTPANGKPMFSRMDRIVVYMKRTQMIQVFSGYLDSIPYKQLYPGTVNFKATCTVKRLMHTWWNPALDMSNTLLNQELTDGSSGDKTFSGNGNDNGLGGMLRNILVLVGGWKYENIHIQNFPEQFFQFLQQKAKEETPLNQAAVLKFKQMILGSDTSPGVGNSAGTNPNSGTPGPYSGTGVPLVPGPPGTGTLFYIQQIIAACDEKGLGPITSDNNQAATTAQAATTGENTQNATQAKAWQQIQQGALDAQNANRDSDAAIIGVATAAVETGGGVAIFNYANPACPGSTSYTQDGVPPYGCDLDSCGIFQQRNSGWGSVQQRMNPKQAAGMFFDAMASKVPNWRNQDPGAVAQTVQQSGYPDRYATAMAWAKIQVQTARGLTAGTSSTVAPINAAAGGSSLPGTQTANTGLYSAPNTNPNLTPAAPTSSPVGVGIPGAGLVGSAVTSSVGIPKPNPDSEGAVQFMLSKCGNTPYVWGASGPNGYDCSGLVRAAFASIGVKITGNTDGMRAGGCPQIPKSQAGRGDIYQPETGHVMVLLGPPGSKLAQGGGVVSASTDGVPLPQQIKAQDWYSEGFEWYGRGALNGGPDTTSPYNPAVASGSGVPPGALDQTAGATGTGSSGSDEQIARNLFSYQFTSQFAGDVATQWPPEKAFIDGQPLIQMVKAVANASLRKFQSAPNGDLFFYYPDWWGLDGKPAVYRMEDIELKDVRIDYSDDPLTTHVYIAGDLTQTGQLEQPEGWLDTAGVITVEDDWIYERLIKVAPGDPESADGNTLLHRYGVRPYKTEYALAGSYELEILLAAQVFMEKWAQQFQTSVSVTFMPELYPGMRIELAGHNLSVYVTEITHICDFEQGFSTQVTIMAPANPNAKAAMASVSTGPLTNTDLIKGFENPVSNSTTDPGSGPIN